MSRPVAGALLATSSTGLQQDQACVQWELVLEMYVVSLVLLMSGIELHNVCVHCVEKLIFLVKKKKVKLL